ncbi:hypothetical protein Clacol_005787 [Clathrus columnatus]|uniref:Uncharacterized protein n=1 Tax=Clathrus columnatus TaxID=1419009 RepID=A0AAV5ADI9_9AGAM|nr:hypothetical protein Clacol_005787 [Clathrus columnatus]
MLRRIPTHDGVMLDRLHASSRLNQPFKPPTINTKKSQVPLRKRKHVNYKDVEDSDAENSGPQTKKRKTRDEGGDYDATNSLHLSKSFPVYTPKPSEVVMTARFSIPEMRSKTGEVLSVIPTNGSLGIRPPSSIPPRPLHDPMQDHAIVLYDPTIDDRETDQEKQERLKEEERIKAEEEVGKKTEGMFNPHKSLRSLLGETTQKNMAHPKVPVVIDPRLSKVLRPHQVEGVKFLYRCTTGMTVDNQYGCIMADEMGLGKTLQCITLLWTLLKQSPRAGRPSVDKCIVVCPSSLVRNWANEFSKWLGKDTVPCLALDGKGTKAEMVARVQRWAEATGRNITLPVLIVSYETLRTLQPYLACAEIGLLLCDEGHRLKNGESLTFTALTSLNVKRRVILSGTPIQNDLSEYFSLLNFANPNFLGSRADFRKNFENAIIRGRDAEATDRDKQLCQEKLQEMTGLVTKFIIRRTNDLLSKYLPVKYEHVVFCGLSNLQLGLYRLFITSPEIRALLRGKDSQPLKAINVLKKLCNHPELLDLPCDLKGSEPLIPQDFVGAKERASMSSRSEVGVHCEWGGKFLVLERYGYFRLDGSMAITKRQKFVDQFNDPQRSEFVFLLSSKAGGCGINLIGANRLILFDPGSDLPNTTKILVDWNPAADQQALARVWRDGQKKEWTIEEKIFQRQASKQALSSCVVDEKQDTERHFSTDELRRLFLFKENTHSETHDTFKCKRCKDGKQFIKAPTLLYGDAST